MKEIHHTKLNELLGFPRGYDSVTNAFDTTEDLLRHQLNLVTKGGAVKRYHTVRTLHTETVAEHSHGVALLCWMVYNEAGQDICTELLLQALVHDLAEHRVGDVPAPAKRVLGISASLGDVEDKVLETARMDSNLTTTEILVLQFADGLQGFLFCLNELRMGNTLVNEPLHNYRDYVKGRLDTLLKVPGPEAAQLLGAAQRIYDTVLNDERSFYNER